MNNNFTFFINSPLLCSSSYYSLFLNVIYFIQWDWKNKQKKEKGLTEESNDVKDTSFFLILTSSLV